MTTRRRRHTFDSAIRARAERVIPSGMYGHQAASRLGSAYPQFFREGNGGPHR